MIDGLNAYDRLDLEKLGVTPLHVERGRQMSEVVQHDIVNRGLSFEAAVESLAEFLGIDPEAVRLAIAIANEEEER